MFSRQLRKFTTQTSNRVFKIISDKAKNSNNECERCNINKIYLETYATIFLVGGLIEFYTYSNTKDITKSTGLGWATLAILLI